MGIKAINRNNKSKTPFYEVNTFADLPAAAGHEGQTYQVLTATGTLALLTKKRAGAYRSDGTNWKRVGTITMSAKAVDPESIWDSRRALNAINIASVHFHKRDPSNSMSYVPVTDGLWFGTSWVDSPVVIYATIERVSGDADDATDKVDIKIIEKISGNLIVEKLDSVVQLKNNIYIMPLTGLTNISVGATEWEIQVRSSVGSTMQTYCLHGAILRDI